MSFKSPTQPAPQPPRGSRRAPGTPILPQAGNFMPQQQAIAEWYAPPGNTIRVRYDNEGKKKDGDEVSQRGSKDKKTSGRTLFHPDGGGDSESTSSRRARAKGNLTVEVSVWLKCCSCCLLVILFSLACLDVYYNFFYLAETQYQTV